MRALTGILLTLALFLTGCTVINGSGDPATETREVSDFDAVSLAGDGALVLTQDGTESLSIEADDNILPVIETYVRRGTLYIATRDNTIIRPVTPIRYTLSVKDIEELGISGDGSVTTDRLESADLQLKIRGDGNMEIGMITASDQFAVDISGDGNISVESVDTRNASIDISGDGNVMLRSLNARELEADIPGDGRITVAGEVVEQSIRIRGDGQFMANELRSSSAEIDISGDGDVSIWVLETMDVEIAGDGHISYAGNPQISQRIRGDGDLFHVEKR